MIIRTQVKKFRIIGEAIIDYHFPNDSVKPTIYCDEVYVSAEDCQAKLKKALAIYMAVQPYSARPTIQYYWETKTENEVNNT